MNFLGKTFVLIYGMGAFFCLMLAVAIYTQKMGFVTTPEQPKVTATRVGVAIENTKLYQTAINRANDRWINEYDLLLPLEAEQARRREFYRTQIELVRKGTLDGNGVDAPVQELKLDPTGKSVEIDMVTGRTPVKVKQGTESAKAQQVYRDGIEAVAGEMVKLQADILQLEKKHVIATNIINGTPEMKGLRTRIKEQDAIAEDADLERIYLEDFVTNRRADAQLFIKRRDALQASIARLIEYYQKRDGDKGN